MMTLPYVTLRDPRLPHQVVFAVTNKHHLTVSCNCRRRLNYAGPETYEPMARIRNLDDARKAYDDAQNHDRPFKTSDLAVW